MRPPRFSLLSLLLFTLLAGSAGALWLHWPAWRPVLELNEPLTHFRFDGTGSYLLLEKYSGGTVLRSFPSGAVWKLSEDAASSESFSPNFEFIESGEGNSTGRRMWDVKRARWIDHGKWTSHQLRSYSPSCEFIIVQSATECALLKTRGGDAILEWSFPADTLYSALITKDESAVVLEFADKIQAWNIQERKKVSEFKNSGEEFRYSSDFSVFSFYDEAHAKVGIFDGYTSRKLFDIPVPEKRDLIVMTLAEDGGHIVVCDLEMDHEIIQVWDIKSATMKLDLLESHYKQKPGRLMFYIDASRIIGNCNEATGPMKQDVWSRKDFKYLKAMEPLDFEIWNAAGFNVRDRSSPPEPTIKINGYRQLRFIPGHAELLVGIPDRSKIPAYPKGIHILARHRPEEWWGIAWLPEFWCTVVFAVLFVGNLWRSRFSR